LDIRETRSTGTSHDTAERQTAANQKVQAQELKISEAVSDLSREIGDFSLYRTYSMNFLLYITYAVYYNNNSCLQAIILKLQNHGTY
jgi:hypothetical protein